MIRQREGRQKSGEFFYGWSQGGFVLPSIVRRFVLLSGDNDDIVVVDVAAAAYFFLFFFFFVV